MSGTTNKQKTNWVLPVIIVLVISSSAIMGFLVVNKPTESIGGQGNITPNKSIEYVNFAVYAQSECKFESREDGSGSASCGMGIGHGCHKAVNGIITLQDGRILSISEFEKLLQETHGAYSLSVTKDKGLYC